MPTLPVNYPVREGDLQQNPDGSLIDNDGLETVFTVAIFTDAPAGPDDGLAPGEDRRGYWADPYEDDPTQITGSKLWLFQRKPLNADLLPQIKQCIVDACAPILAAGVASAVDVIVTRAASSAIDIAISATHPGPNSPYENTWRAFFASQ